MLKFHSLKVADVSPDAEEAASLSFEVPPNLRDAYCFEAGQHLGIRVQLAGEEVRRTYSIMSAPDDPELRIGVRVHTHGKLSRHLAHKVRAGDTLEVLTPNGSFHTTLGAGDERTYVAFTAGSGITPVLSILRNTLAREPRSRFLLFYGNQNAARTMFMEELLALKDVHLARLSLNFLFTREPQDVALLNGRIDRHKVRELAGTLFDATGVDEYFLCGPGDMNDEVTAALLELGVHAEHIHGERFAVAEATSAPQPHAVTPAASGETTRVSVVMDGRRRSFTMARDGETVLEAAEQAGLDLPFSCRAGVCSTCRTKLAHGAVEMAANYALEPWEVEAGFVLACQSRPTTPELELDYDQR
ncbi:MAG TPA: 2Fe-2S iron-sulfur cluster-binding protein [Steroidobacteraceae bacterium]|nr:2Fe-2S iron-sulfur cluster-binding protein [Steroidobacteraceae bacterium]